MWEKVKEIKMILGIAAVIVPMTIAGITWLANNLVFASEFNSHNLRNDLRWATYDEQRLRSEYYALRNLRKLEPRDKRRLQDIEAELDHAAAKRLELEREIRSASRVKLSQ